MTDSIGAGTARPLGFSGFASNLGTSRPRPDTVVRPRHVFHISRVWGSRHGGSLYSQVLVQQLRQKGWSVTLVAEQFCSDEPLLERIELKVFFQRSIGLWHTRVLEIFRLWQRVTKTPGAIVIVQGDLPRIVYVLLQRRVPLIFIRQDGILTCPANNRFLRETRSVCCRTFGWSCLRVHRQQNCFGNLRLWHRLGRLCFRFRDRWLLRCLRHVVFNSRYIAEVHHRPGAVLYPPRMAAQNGPKPRRDLRRLLFCGRLEQVKGAAEAVRVLSLLPQTFYLEILGDGPERGHLARLVQELDLVRRVKFHGWVDAKTRDRLLASAGALLMLSQWDEAFGMVGLEAFAQGTPVVAYDVGGISEWCRDGAGLLVPSGNVRAAATAVRILATDPAQWQSYSRRARRVAEQEFSVERFARELDQILEMVAAGARG